MELNTEMVYELAPYARTLGIECEEATPEKVTVRLENREELSTIGGGMHGGAVMGLCDLTAAICAGLNVPEGHVGTTAQSTTYFLKPVQGPAAIATGRAVKAGRSLVTVEVDVHTNDGEHCARTSQMLLVREVG